MPHVMHPAAGQLDEKSIITLLDLETTKKLKESGCAPKEKNVVRHFSLKSAQKRKNNLDRTKVKVILSPSFWLNNQLQNHLLSSD